MKKIFAWLTCILPIVLLTACGQSSPVLKVVIQPKGSDAEDYEYLVVYDNEKTAATDLFVPDDVASYTAESRTFVSDVVNNRVVNTLESTILIDENGNKTDADEIMTAIMQTAADSIDHDIMEFTILVDGDRYFAFVKLNVNWSDPCILYEYDTATGRLIELCRWDGAHLMGISIK